MSKLDLLIYDLIVKIIRVVDIISLPSSVLSKTVSLCVESRSFNRCALHISPGILVLVHKLLTSSLLTLWFTYHHVLIFIMNSIGLIICCRIGIYLSLLI
jgi:hypothetical protein